MRNKYTVASYDRRGPINNTPNARQIDVNVHNYIGVVTSVNPVNYTVEVITEQGVIDNNIFILNQANSAIERSQEWLQSFRGKKVIVSKVSNLKYVLGTLPTNITTSDTTVDSIPFIAEGTGGDTEATYKAGVINNINISRKDYLDGDKVLSTSDNTSLGLFKGGLSNWKVSNLTQIILHKMKALIRMVTRNFELFTDFGKITINNSEGKTSLKIDGGASFKDETMPGVDKYSLSVEMGNIESDEKQRLKITIKDPNNDSSKVDVGIGIDGIIQISCSDKAEIRSTKEIVLASDKDLTINSSNTLTLMATKSIDMVSNGSVNIQSAMQGTSIQSTGIVGINGKLITLN